MPAATDRSFWAITGVAVLGLLVVGIVAVGLNTSLGPLRDTALVAHIEPGAARLWWIGIDGLIVVAIVAAMILRHDPAARRYALGIVAIFTAASGLLQFLHGLGWTTPDTRSGEVGPLPWQVVAVIAVLVIGTIFCGTHLFVYVLRYLFPRALSDQARSSVEGPAGPVVRQPESIDAETDTGDGSAEEGRSGEGEQPLPEPDPVKVAALVYAACLDADVKLSRERLAKIAKISERQAGYVRTDVEIERAETAERERLAAEQEQMDPAETVRQTSLHSGKKINGSPAQADPVAG
ncbi:hypothetical protein [Nonomuraea sp. NPDC003754]